MHYYFGYLTFFPPSLTISYFPQVYKQGEHLPSNLNGITTVNGKWFIVSA